MALRAAPQPMALALRVDEAQRGPACDAGPMALRVAPQSCGGVRQTMLPGAAPESSAPKPKPGAALCRRLQRERVACPRCGKSVQIATLRHYHRCASAREQPAPEVVQDRLEKMRNRAVKALLERTAPEPGAV